VRVSFVRSGGLAGLDLVATVDSADLSGDQQAVVFALLTKDLRGPGMNRPGGSDQFSYRLDILAGDSTVRRQWQEPDVNEMVRPLLAALTRRAKPVR
jgi:hypothetical protein